MKDLAIKMFETHRRRPDPSEVYRANELDGTEMEGGDGDEQEEDDLEEPEIEWADGNGEVFLLRPKRAPKARNAPGAAVTASKGAINQFRSLPNSRPKGAGKGGGGLTTMRETWSLLAKTPGNFSTSTAWHRERPHLRKEGRWERKDWHKRKEHIPGWW